MAALLEETVRVPTFEGWYAVGRLRPTILTASGHSEAEAKTALMNEVARLSAVVI